MSKNLASLSSLHLSLVKMLGVTFLYDLPMEDCIIHAKVKITEVIANLKNIFASSLTPRDIEQKTMRQTKATKQVKTVH